MHKFCPKCDSENVKFITEVHSIKYKGKDIKYSKEICLCKECDTKTSSVDTKVDAFINKEKVKIDEDLILSPKEIMKIRHQLNWTQAKAQFYLGGGVKSFSKYERGERKIGVAATTLLKALKLGYITEDMLDNINNDIPNEDKDRCPQENTCHSKISMEAKVANHTTSMGIAERLQKMELIS